MTPLPPDGWPLRAHSTVVTAAGMDWHLQQVGAGPDILLIHGTGGSTHSWAAIIPLLADRFRLTAIDLPGHGFSGTPAAGPGPDPFSLEGMSALLAGLLDTIGLVPRLAAGHSAGAAVLLRGVLDGRFAPAALVGLNPALIPPPEAYVRLVAPWLDPVFTSRLLGDSAAWLARTVPVVDWLLASAGRPLDRATLERYRTLFRRGAHVRAALSMMARWDLPRLVRDAAALTTPLHVVAGALDRWVPPEPLRRSAQRIPTATFEVIDDAGHLLPEEQPRAVAELLAARATRR